MNNKKKVPSGVHSCFLTGGHSGKAVSETDSFFVRWEKDTAVNGLSFMPLFKEITEQHIKL